MKPNRREFLEVTGAAIALSTVSLPSLGESLPMPYDSPRILHGDPYAASAFHDGLGGSSFDEMCARMTRERTDGDELHRVVLGLERDDA